MTDHSARRCVVLPVVLLAVLLAAGCATNRHIGFPYPNEQLVPPADPDTLPAIAVGEVRDLRPRRQRDGRGHFTGIDYPGDHQWDVPVTAMYRRALARDIDQTRLGRVVPLPAEADYLLEAEILSFGCRLERRTASLLLPAGVGALGGLAWGTDGSDQLKRGLLLSVVALGALPVPARQHAAAEVRLLVRDRAGDLIWETTCAGNLDRTVAETFTARRDRTWAERYMPQAVKRCNACLLGQLRQFLASRP